MWSGNAMWCICCGKKKVNFFTGNKIDVCLEVKQGDVMCIGNTKGWFV